VSLEAEIASGAHPELPRLHPNLSEVYRERVERLREAIAADRSPEFVESVRALIERVEVHPGADGERSARIELVGHLASMLRLSRWMRGRASAYAELCCGSGRNRSRLAVAGLRIHAGFRCADLGTLF
jgi:hypothetical protein